MFFYGKSCHHQCSLTMSLQVSRGTRGAEQRANMNPPPPPPPNLAELMQMMVENQRMLTETINRMANQVLGILNIITKSRLSFLILVTVQKMPNLSLIPLKPSCHPQHDMRGGIEICNCSSK